MPEVSVIIPNYNHAPFLKERIESVINQTFRDFEVIVIDDASRDESRRIIEQYRNHPKVSHVIYNTENSGSPFLQWAKGTELATGEWIWIAESDDVAATDFLEKMLVTVHKATNTSFAYCNSAILSFPAKTDPFTTAQLMNKKQSKTKWNEQYVHNGIHEINESLKWDCGILNASSVLFNRKYLVADLPQIMTYRYHGDWLLYIMLALRGDVAYTSEPLNTFRKHRENHSDSDTLLRQFKIEHFRILDFLLTLDAVTEKNKLLRHFITHYIGFGFLKEPGFGKKGIFRHFTAVNPSLARKVVLKLLLKKLGK